MKRRQLLQALFVTLPAVTAGTVILSSKVLGANHVPPRSLKAMTHLGRRLEIEEGGNLENLGLVRCIISGTRKTRTVDISKVKKGNRFKYTTGYIPFGEEFDSAEEVCHQVIELGVLDLD